MHAECVCVCVCRLLVYSVVEESRGRPLHTLSTPGRVTCLSFLHSRLYTGMCTGDMMIYSRDAGQSVTTHHSLAMCHKITLQYQSTVKK